MVLSSLGFVDIYRVQSGECRGRIECPYFSNNLSIDPSGLYFTVTSYSNAIEEEMKSKIKTAHFINETAKEKAANDIHHYFNRKIEKNNKVILFELGSGEKIGQLGKFY